MGTDTDTDAAGVGARDSRSDTGDRRKSRTSIKMVKRALEPVARSLRPHIDEMPVPYDDSPSQIIEPQIVPATVMTDCPDRGSLSLGACWLYPKVDTFADCCGPRASLAFEWNK